MYRFRAEYSDPSSQFRELFDDLQSKSQCCGVESPLDYNGSFWQMTETRYFLDYERALNTSLNSDHVGKYLSLKGRFIYFFDFISPSSSQAIIALTI